jgi:hypothetical protein
MNWSLPVFAAMIPLLLAAVPARAAVCANDSTGLVPLNDLGMGTYLGYQGGLYPGGSNQRPAAHDAAGVAIAHAIVPLDTLGQPDPAGRIVLISIGMSNATQEFSVFVPMAMQATDRHPRLLVIDCARGGQAAQDMLSPHAAYWDTVATRLRGRGSSPAQVQAVWLKQAMRAPTGGFAVASDTLARYLGTIVRNIKDALPNVKLLHHTSRIYAGYASTALNPEPYAYGGGFAFKWLLESQIAGEDSLNWDPDQGPVEAPWMAWGPYLWADGLEPRSDGMTWACAEFASDGVHPGPLGRQRVADSLLVFYRNDDTTRPWFTNVAKLAVDDVTRAADRVVVSPNPAGSRTEIRFVTGAAEPWRLDVHDLAGRRVRALAHGLATGGPQTRTWDGRDDAGRPLRAGVYLVRLTNGARRATARVVLGVR